MVVVVVVVVVAVVGWLVGWLALCSSKSTILYSTRLFSTTHG